MRSTLVALSVGLLCLGASSAALAKKPKAAAPAKGDGQVEQTLSWEQKVMGDDAAKRADMEKINAARVAQEKAKNAPPPAPVKKDPNKEGVRAKGEASIDLPIAEEEPTHTTKTPSAKKAKAAAPSSANDELGQLVAASLQEDKSGASGKGSKAKAKGGGAKKQDPLSAMDQMLATDGH